MDDFKKYREMRESGADTTAVYQQAIADGVDPITVVRMMRAVFALDLAQAKEAIAIAEGEPSLSAAQSKLVGGLRDVGNEEPQK